MVLLLDLVDIQRRLRELHVEHLQGLGDDLGDGEVAEPLVVRGDDEPGSVLGSARAERVLERLGVGVPERALGIVPLAVSVGWQQALDDRKLALLFVDLLGSPPPRTRLSRFVALEPAVASRDAS
ncbi:MAG: hypothetical protein WCA32_07340 [Chromatiaceae bacterium]